MSRLRFLPVAASEVAEAESWYGDRSPELQRRLHAAVRDASADIDQWPDSHPVWPLPAGDQREVRSAPVRGFPYRLFYWVTPDVVWVLACAHTSREPDYWVDRT